MKPPSSYEIPTTTRPILGPLRVSTSAPSSSSVVHGNHLFDLDGLQIKKLQQLIKHSHELDPRNNISKECLGDYKRKQKIFQLEKEKMEECRLRRYEMSTVSLIYRLAAAGDEFNLREQLMIENFDVNGRDIFGRTVLITACIFGHSNIVRMLLRNYNVDICRTSLLSGQSPLHFAVIAGSRPIVLLFMTSHANVNALDRQRCTALHLVNNLAIIKLLLKNGADPCIRSHEVSIYH
jgi:ankyrin repeat protein